MNPNVKSFFDEDTFTATHVVSCPATKKAAIIDSVMDYDSKSGRTTTTSADAVIDYVQAEGLDVEWNLETHVHADHLSAAPYLRNKLGGKIGIGSKIDVVQGVFKGIFNAEEDFATDGSQFGKLFDDEETFMVGNLAFRVMHTPGHTPACVTYVVGDTAFVGDTLFMPDFGTARCDFPGGDARILFASIKKVLSLPDDTRLFMCHDYAPNGRDYILETTVADERANNIHVKDGTSEDSFVDMRTTRDAQLDMPVLILPSVQVNMRAGDMPPAEDNGVRYLKIPVNAL